MVVYYFIQQHRAVHMQHDYLHQLALLAELIAHPVPLKRHQYLH